MIVDATWDKKLGSKLPISEWDGKSDTVIAVKLTKMLRKKAHNLERPSEARWKEYIKAEGQFVESLNRWLDSIRAYT